MVLLKLRKITMLQDLVGSEHVDGMSNAIIYDDARTKIVVTYEKMIKTSQMVPIMGSCKLGGLNTGLLVLLQILEEKVYQYCFQYFPELLHNNNTGTILEDTGN